MCISISSSSHVVNPLLQKNHLWSTEPWKLLGLQQPFIIQVYLKHTTKFSFLLSVVFHFLKIYDLNFWIAGKILMPNMNLKPIMEIYFTKIDLVERLWICTSVLFEAEWKTFKTFVFIFEVNIFNISLKMYLNCVFENLRLVFFILLLHENLHSRLYPAPITFSGRLILI